MEGSEALARAAIVAGCRFFAGYPMTPFTEVLEHFARLLPDAGGVCINAESELEAVGMTWGALATGARAATGSTGQGLSLMQESFSEITLAELPLVVFNMARGQQDYYQATRGGGHGDYRHIVLAPQDVTEGVELVQLAFHLADKWRNPALVYGDYLLAHTQEAITIEPMSFPELPAKDWAVDGSLSGTGSSRAVTPLGVGKVGQPALGQEGKAQYIATKLPLDGARGARRDRLPRRRGDRDRRVRLAGQVREVRDPPAARGRSPHRVRAPDHAVAVPVRDRRRRGRGPERAAHRQLRALGRPDGRRRSHRRRRPRAGRRSSAACRPTTPASVSGRHPRRRRRRRAAARAARRPRAAVDPRLRRQQLRAAAPPSGGHPMTTTDLPSVP